MVKKKSHRNFKNDKKVVLPIAIPLWHDVTDLEKENLLPAPLFLIEDNDGNVHLLKRFSTQKTVSALKQPKVNILIELKSFSSLAELLFDIIELREWYYLPTEQSHEIALRAIDYTFLTDDPFSRDCSPSERLNIFCQTETKMRYQSAIEPDFFQKEQFYKQNSKMPTPEELAKFCKENKQIIPQEPVRSFSNSTDLLYWLINELAARNTQILECPNCSRLFYRTSGKTKYCSNKCAKEANKTGKFCEDDEIKASYYRIYQLFAYRKKSGATYILSEIDEAINQKLLEFLPDHKADELFDATDIAKIRKKYSEREKKKNTTFREAFKKYKSQTISKDEFITIRNDFQIWLHDVEHFIRSFQEEK